MSIRNVYIVTCDGCGASEESTGPGHLTRLYEKGWSTDYENDRDYCPACTAARRAPGAPTPAARGGEQE